MRERAFIVTLTIIVNTLFYKKKISISFNSLVDFLK